MSPTAKLVAGWPIVRYVHDHVVFCPSHNKYRENGETCRDAMGFICLKRYVLEGGCVCFKPDRYADPLVHPVKEWIDKRRELKLTKRVGRVLTNSHYMREQLLQVGFDAVVFDEVAGGDCTR